MSKQRIIKDEIWDDNWFYDLSPNEKLVWLFLLTNPRCNIAGIYKMSVRWAAQLLNISEADVAIILENFKKEDKVRMFGNWIFLPNFVKHQSQNPKVKAGIVRIVYGLPREVCSHFFDQVFEERLVARNTRNFAQIKKEQTECVQCGSQKQLQVDHKVPLFAGGDNDMSNLQVLCQPCHIEKSKEDFITYENFGEIAYSTLLNSTLLNLSDIAVVTAPVEPKKTDDKKEANPFSLAEEIKKLEDSPRRDLNVVAMYLEHRKPDLQNREQYQVALRRHLRAAKALANFTDQQIIKALKFADKEYKDIGWTLETLTKILTK